MGKGRTGRGNRGEVSNDTPPRKDLELAWEVRINDRGRMAGVTGSTE